MDKPQIIAHVQKSMNYTLFDCRWVPCSAKFVVLGNHARGTGALQIYEMSHGDISLIHEVYDYFLVFWLSRPTMHVVYHSDWFAVLTRDIYCY